MKIVIPIKAEVRGRITLGPKPGTPEFEEEQRCKAEGRAYDYSSGKQLDVILDVMPGEGHQG